MKTSAVAPRSRPEAGRWVPVVDIASATVTTWLIVAAATGAGGTLRAVAALVFVTFVPGWALLAHLKIGDQLTRLALAVPLSWTICGVLATIMLWVHAWRPLVLLYALGVPALASLVLRVAPPDSWTRSEGGGDTPAPPTWLGQVDVGHDLEARPVSRPVWDADAIARVFVRLHHQPLGYISVPIQGRRPTSDDIDRAVRAQLQDELREHLERDGLEIPTPLPPDGLGHPASCSYRPTMGELERLTVVVCTREHPDLLEECLAYLQRLDHPDFEVVIVDNAPTTDGTRTCFDRMVGDDPRFRYVREPAPGLSRARNRGLAESRTRWTVFTDDDVRVDPWWLKGIADGIARASHAGCVTGMVPPTSLDDRSQQYFDRRYSWASHWRPRVYGPDDTDVGPVYPYSPGIFGTGANFAVDRDLMVSLGGFDEALGAGTPTGGGEDLDAFVRILQAGRPIVFEPSGVVWHVHRGEDRELRRQLFFYGVGLSAFLAKHVADGRTRSEVLRRVLPGLRRMSRMWDSEAIGGKAPPAYVATEALGFAWGPVALLRARRWRRRTAPHREDER